MKPKRTQEQFIAKFWSQVERRGDDDCWLWNGYCDDFGYGNIVEGGRNSRRWKAHRLSYSLLVGDPGSLCVLHECDVPACVNPNHLFLGTRTDNAQDKVSKGRQRGPKGEAHPKAKLTAGQVRTIRRRYASGVLRSVLAREYGVAWNSIKYILNKRNWKHIQ